MSGLFEASFSSLRQFQCPDWFRDVKFGIWSHWGPQSVPMFGDWYARNMYVEGTSQYYYHLRHYGHPSKFGYKDICALWKAENFDPDGLMKLYYEAGARYFVGQAMHHDHFFNYPSKFNGFNSMKVGPNKDICGLWKKAAKKYDMPFGLTEHLGATFNWWACNKGADKKGAYKGVPYDGSDPAYKDFYLENEEHYNPESNGRLDRWYTSNQKYHQYWLNVIKEIIDLYEPDLIYTDGGLPFGNIFDLHTAVKEPMSDNDPLYAAGLEAVSYFYNASIKKHGDNRAVYTQKDMRPSVYNIGVLDIERSQLPDIHPSPWQTDTCIGGWFYNAQGAYKSPEQVIEMLVDIIAKNGTMLLNILQKPDGTIDDEANYILKELAKWFAVCGEGVYGTRPWKTSGEGTTKVLIDGFKELKTDWNSSDFRFTCKGSVVYAFMLKAPDNGTVVMHSFADEKVREVRLLGGDNLPFSQEYGILIARLPEALPTGYTNCLAITLA